MIFDSCGQIALACASSVRTIDSSAICLACGLRSADMRVDCEIADALPCRTDGAVGQRSSRFLTRPRITTAAMSTRAAAIVVVMASVLMALCARPADAD